MANPEVDRLIQELSTILEQNRQRREVVDSHAQGMAQGQQRTQGAQQATAAMSHAILGGPETGYGGDRAASPYNTKNSPSPSAKSLSPSTSREGRVALGQRYAEAHGGHSPREQELLSKNPYTGSKYEFLPENDTPAPAMNPGDQAVLDERKKRFMQNMMLSRGQQGPLGGAGQPASDPNTGLDPSVVAAVSRPTAVAPMAAQPPGAPTGWSPEDYQLLSEASAGRGMLR